MPGVQERGVAVAVVGLGFGQDFVPIYLSHPQVSRVVVVEPDSGRLQEVSQRFGITDSYPDIESVLVDPAIDAVHLLTPVHLHAELSIAALNAGKHVACAVPMATSLADIDRIIAAQRASGTNYMMMETSVYGREFLTVEQMYRSGDIGTLTLYRGFHLQNLDGYPSYWQGYPPMHYLTHALSPVLALLDTTVQSVQCQGAGRLAPERTTGNFDNPFPTEVGLFRLAGSDALVDITMSFSQTARSYVEGFALYGDRGGVEWPPDDEPDLLRYDMYPPAEGTRGNVIKASTMPAGDFSPRLPVELAPFTQASDVQFPAMSRPAKVNSHHGGSHPHLVVEFVGSIVDHRPARVDATCAARWTAPGICAHDSAMAAGEIRRVPQYHRVGPFTALHPEPSPHRRTAEDQAGSGA